MEGTNIKEAEINFDALANPEQSEEVNAIENEVPSPEQEGDLTESIAKELGIEIEKEVPVNENIVKQTEESQYTIKDAIRDGFKSKFGDEFDLPEDFSDENWVEKVIDIVNTKSPSQKELHPIAKQIQEAAEKGLDIEEIFANVAATKAGIQNATDEDLVMHELASTLGKSEKRPNGWDETKIKSVIDNMKRSGVLEVEAEKIRAQAEERSRQVLETTIKEKEIQRERITIERQKAIDNKISTVMDTFNKWDDIYGLKLGQAEKSQFAKEFPDLVKPDPKTGLTWIEQQLSNDETLAKVTYFLKYGDSFKGAITRASEAGKEKILGKLDPNPRVKRATGSDHEGGIDLDALASPEKLKHKN